MVAVSPARNVPLSRRSLLVGAAGVVGVLVLAGATSSVRTELGVANVALGLAVVSIAVALVTWRGGLATSLTAALALNWFHTDPVHTLRISHTEDVLAVALLAGLGVGVSLVTAVRVRQAAVAARSAGAVDAAIVVRAATVTDGPVGEVWMRLIDAVTDQLGLVDCRVGQLSDLELPIIARHRWTDDSSGDHRLVLPESGAVVPFGDPRDDRCVVLTPRSGIGAVEVDRRVVLAFVDQLALVVAG